MRTVQTQFTDKNGHKTISIGQVGETWSVYRHRETPEGDQQSIIESGLDLTRAILRAQQSV